jgi:hypothetical protein
MSVRSLGLLPLLALDGCAPEPSPPGAQEARGPATAEPASLPTALPPETDLPPTATGRWSLACGAALDLAPGGRLELFSRAGLRRLGGEVVGRPAVSADGRRIAFSHAPEVRPETEIAIVACEDGTWGEVAPLARGPGSPDRVAISPDGAWVAWFSGASGLPSLWVAPFYGGDALQVTNAGVRLEGAAPGQPPAGFVPPPHLDPPAIEALGQGRYRARWLAPDGEHASEWP